MKGLRYDDESYVKVYTRDTLEWEVLSFDASSLHLQLWRKLDRSGAFIVGDVVQEDVPRALAKKLNSDEPRMAAALAELIRKKFVVMSDADGQLAIVFPYYVAAQSARTADRIRQQEKRVRDRDRAISSAKPFEMLDPRPPSSDGRPSQMSRSDQIRIRSGSEQNRTDISPNGECEGGPAPKTEPNPSLRGKKLDEAVGKATEALSREETKPDALLLTPAPTPEAPKAKSKTKPKAPAPEQRVITLSPAEQAAVGAIRNDPDLLRICKNVEQLAVDLVNCAPLVDVALELRGLGAYMRTDKGRAKRYSDGNGYLLNNIQRKQAEQAQRQADMPQFVEAPKPPRPYAPAPPMHPMVAAGAARAAERRARGELPDLTKLFDIGMRTPQTIDELAALAAEAT
jgi:hypothetical protein